MPVSVLNERKIFGMANTSSRMLRLLSLLQNHRHWAGTELADRLEVSIRTLRRDVDRLRELGYPVQAQRGVDGGYQLAPGAALPPLMGDDEEGGGLAIRLQAAAQGAAPGVLPSVARAGRADERLRFSYTAAGGQQPDRHVEPHRLVSLA